MLTQAQINVFLANHPRVEILHVDREHGTIRFNEDDRMWLWSADNEGEATHFSCWDVTGMFDESGEAHGPDVRWEERAQDQMEAFGF